MSNIIVLQRNIVGAHVDVIVNAAKPSLMGGSGVDGVIHKAAGNTLLEECLNIEAKNGVRCPIGEVRVTGAGNLKAKYVIHTVGPIYDETAAPPIMLGLTYKNCLKKAVELEAKSIAFPAISCGKYGYPYEKASKVAIDVCRKYSPINLKIYFYILEFDGYLEFKKEAERRE